MLEEILNSALMQVGYAMQTGVEKNFGGDRTPAIDREENGPCRIYLECNVFAEVDNVEVLQRLRHLTDEENNHHTDQHHLLTSYVTHVLLTSPFVRQSISN